MHLVRLDQGCRFWFWGDLLQLWQVLVGHWLWLVTRDGLLLRFCVCIGLWLCDRGGWGKGLYELWVSGNHFLWLLLHGGLWLSDRSGEGLGRNSEAGGVSEMKTNRH